METFYFFWGFIATAGLGYGSALLAERPHQNLALLIACFGLICSFCWSLVNRGSKYWQEHWERKVTDFELTLGATELFRAEDKRDNSKSWWLGSRKFSVSRLAIALSDFTVFIWIGLIFNRLLSFIPYQHIHLSSETKIIFCTIFTVIYAIFIWLKCKSKPWQSSK